MNSPTWEDITVVGSGLEAAAGSLAARFGRLSAETRGTLRLAF